MHSVVPRHSEAVFLLPSVSLKPKAKRSSLDKHSTGQGRWQKKKINRYAVFWAPKCPQGMFLIVFRPLNGKQ